MGKLTKRELGSTLRSFSGVQFERFLEEFWERQGLQADRVGRKSDHIDIFIHTPREEAQTIGVQAMCWRNTVGRSELVDLGPATNDFDFVRVVTTSTFSDPARAYAHHKSNIDLWDKRRLCKKIVEANDLALVQQYADGVADWNCSEELAARLNNLGLDYTKREARAILPVNNRAQKIHNIEAEAFGQLR